ncbi:MAG: hypothetical protein CMI02_10135 [Oceanospirillaceae bacterium]|nr:hypothetical protein [Oceanospirillaceae bacterium]MBT12381.1 hypothetical protein [Oceanospirillaceae bacterium]|tara:strand:- start:19585 stop:20727 length:1143 start_codon:yes stop_codon:yes gene_type:complete
MSHPVSSFSFLLLPAFLLAACSTPQIAEIDNLPDLTSQMADALGNDSDKALRAAEQAYDKARQEELAFYAPLHMERLQAAMKDVQRSDLSGDRDALIQSSALVQTLLKTALDNKQEVESTLLPLLTQKSVLQDIHADKVLADDYADAMDDMKDLITLIEAGNKEKAVKKSAAVLEELTELEPEAMLAIHWRPAEQTLEQAEDEDADHNAPATFAAAEAVVESARQTILEHYKDRQHSEEVGLAALRKAQHALYVGRAAEKLQKLKPAEAEQKALDFENYLHDISAAIEGDDLRHMELRDQALAIIQALRERERQYHKTLESAAKGQSSQPQANSEASAAAPAETEAPAQTTQETSAQENSAQENTAQKDDAPQNGTDSAQ